MSCRRRVTIEQRRRSLVRRHHLAGDAAGPLAVVRALIALHATDPASVYLSVLARSHGSTLDDVGDALYGTGCLVRWMAMRRTLFVFAADDVPTIHAAVGAEVGAMLRRRLLSRLRRDGTDPAIDGDVGRWLERVQTRVEGSLRRREEATGAQLAADEPALRTTILAGSPSQRPQNLTTPLLTVLSAEGRIVRGAAVGPWTGRQHRWEPIARRWPSGLPDVDPIRARRELARRWLQRFGPAEVDDLRWWTGWNTTVTRAALAALPIQDVDLHGRPGIALEGPDEPPATGSDDPCAALLPALDPTAMGFKQRDWLLGIDPAEIFDRAGNIGPTVWWDGEIVGSWAVTPSGRVRTAVLADRGADARGAVDAAADRLEARLHGAVVTPAARTPLERTIAEGVSPGVAPRPARS